MIYSVIILCYDLLLRFYQLIKIKPQIKKTYILKRYLLNYNVLNIFNNNIFSHPPELNTTEINFFGILTATKIGSFVYIRF